MNQIDLLRGLIEANAELGVAVVELLVLVNETIPLYEILLNRKPEDIIGGEIHTHLDKLKAKGTR